MSNGNGQILFRYYGNVLSMSQATETSDGWLSSVDWNRFSDAADSAVKSVFGRAGAVIAQSDDYAEFYQPIGTTGLPPGGTTSQLLGKVSPADFDVDWFDPPVTTATEDQWKYSTNNTIDDPGNGKFRTNNALIGASTIIALSDISSSNVDRTGLFQALQSGDQLFLQDSSNATNWVRYQVTGAPIDHATWFEIPVSALTGGGATVGNNAAVLFSFQHVTSAISLTAGSGISLSPNPIVGTGTISVDPNLISTAQLALPLSGHTWAMKAAGGGFTFTMNLDGGAELLGVNNAGDLNINGLYRFRGQVIIPTGGTTGQVLTKNSNSDFDDVWATPVGAVASVFGRTGAVVATTNDYTFAQIGSKPTTLTGYGITDAEPYLGNPSTNGYILSSTTAGARSWIAPPTGGGGTTSTPITQNAHGFIVGDILYYTGSAYAKARADNVTTAEVAGIVGTVTDANNFTLFTCGLVTGLSGLTAGTAYFLSPSTAGTLTATEPRTSGTVSKPVLIAVSTTSGLFFNFRGFVNGSPSTAVSQKNYIVNGAMMVSQENGSTAGTVAGYYPADQFLSTWSMGGALSVAQVASLTPAGSTSRIRTTVTTADASVAAGDIVYLVQRMEGLRVADLGFGTAAAKTVTIRFGVKAPAGTYCVAISNGTRAYVAEYTIAAGEANTDVVRSITIPGDTAGTWLTTNAAGMEIRWCLMAGTTYQQAAASWLGTNGFGSSNQSNFMGTLGNVFELFDVGLYQGTVAPTFQVPDYASELAACRRYYWRRNFTSLQSIAILQASATTSAFGLLINLPVEMRTAPATTVPSYTHYSLAGVGGGSLPLTTISTITGFTDSVTVGGVTVASGLVAGNATSFFANQATWMQVNARM